MDFREEIQNILKSKGIGTAVEANKAIFGIATLGLLMGKDEFLELAYMITVDDRKRLRNRAVYALATTKEKEIAFRGFYGEYEITVGDKTYTVNLDEDGKEINL